MVTIRYPVVYCLLVSMELVEKKSARHTDFNVSSYWFSTERREEEEEEVMGK